MEHYLSIKRNEPLIYATTWTNHTIVLSGKKNPQKVTYRIIPSIYITLLNDKLQKWRTD